MKITIYIVSIILLINFNFIKDSKLKIGDKIPEFSLYDQYGNEFNSHDFVGNKNLVIYFYPKGYDDRTIEQMLLFKNNNSIFKNNNTKLIGISTDFVVKQREISLKYKLPFTILSDLKNRVRKQFGIKKKSARISYIINKDGKIVSIYSNKKSVSNHITNSIRTITNLPYSK